MPSVGHSHNMEYIVGAFSDVGIKKKTNQDAIAVKTAVSDLGPIAFGIICDGLGGLSSGEVASSNMLKMFTEWFSSELPYMLGDGKFEETLKNKWTSMVFDANSRLMNYGEQRGINLGTTLTAALFYAGKYYVIHVGDSRLYEFTENSARQLTNDHSFVAREVAMGRMTPEQARVDKRKNILLQCIGANASIAPDFYSGDISANAVYMFCSDGFRNKPTDEILYSNFKPSVLPDADAVRQTCCRIIEWNKSQHETDNISVGVIKVV